MSDSVWLYMHDEDDFVFSVHRTKEGAEAKLKDITDSLARRGMQNIKIRIQEYELEP